MKPSPAAPPLSALVDKIHAAGEAKTVSIHDLVETIGPRSFAALMLIFALVAVSPASVVPGVTTAVALVELILVAQMIAGRKKLWLPETLSKREIAGSTLQKGMARMQKPIAKLEAYIKPRWEFLTTKPVLTLWLLLILGLTLFMPFMEVIPGSGSVASTFIALVAAAILTHDGMLMVLAGGCLIALVSLLIWLGGVIF